jgi:hypothetical protein
MPETINSLKKYNEIIPVYVSAEMLLYTCYHYFKATKCDKYKINAGQVCYRVHIAPSHQSRYAGNLPMTFYLHGPDLASYPVTDYFRL